MDALTGSLPAGGASNWGQIDLIAFVIDATGPQPPKKTTLTLRNGLFDRVQHWTMRPWDQRHGRGGAAVLSARLIVRSVRQCLELDFSNAVAREDALSGMGPLVAPLRRSAGWTILGIIQAFLMLEPLSVMDLRHLDYFLVQLRFGLRKPEKDDACRGKCRARHQALARDRSCPIAWSLAGRRPHGRCHFRPLRDSETSSRRR
jgi:hypothetical protein